MLQVSLATIDLGERPFPTQQNHYQVPMMMKTTLRYRGLNAQSPWQALVAAQLKPLENLVTISSARVVLERRWESRPAFRVQALLEVPGPDYHADSVDYTLKAALHKVVRNLDHQIRARLGRRVDRRRSNLQLGINPTVPP